MVFANHGDPAEGAGRARGKAAKPTRRERKAKKSGASGGLSVSNPYFAETDSDEEAALPAVHIGRARLQSKAALASAHAELTDAASEEAVRRSNDSAGRLAARPTHCDSAATVIYLL